MLYNFLFNAERRAEKLSLPVFFMVFDLTKPRIKPESNILVADALSTRPLIGLDARELRLKKQVC